MFVKYGYKTDEGTLDKQLLYHIAFLSLLASLIANEVQHIINIKIIPKIYPIGFKITLLTTVTEDKLYLKDYVNALNYKSIEFHIQNDISDNYYKGQAIF